jgi:Molybdopterin-guanine dinucleotide biosynthesis protein A
LFSCVVLAGGKSERMGRDKAFLVHRGKPFVFLVVRSALEVAEKVVVCIGNKNKEDFLRVLPNGVLVVNDSVNFGTPLSGIFTGFTLLKQGYCAVVACDMPLLKKQLLVHLFELAKGYDAAVPLWKDGALEPLLAVYRIEATLSAIKHAVKRGEFSPRQVVLHLKNVRYVDIEELRAVDPKLESFLNINTPEDYKRIS